MSADEDPHKPLREDVSLLGEMLGATLRAREGHTVFEIVEQVRHAAKAARERGDHLVIPLEQRLKSLPLDVAMPVARAFRHARYASGMTFSQGARRCSCLPTWKKPRAIEEKRAISC